MVALLMLRTLVPRGGRGGENELYFLRILGDGAVDREAKLGVLNVFLMCSLGLFGYCVVFIDASHMRGSGKS